MTAQGAQVIPPAHGGAGRYTWDASTVITNTYNVRRGGLRIARVALYNDVPADHHDAVLDGFCRILDQQQGDVR